VVLPPSFEMLLGAFYSYKGREMNKTCCKCRLEKTSEEFGKSTDSKDGLKYSCKLCRNKENTEYRRIHKKPPVVHAPYQPPTKKTCSICKQEKPVVDFNSRKDRPCGVTSQCKSRWREMRMRKWRTDEIYREKCKKTSKKFQINNKDYIAEWKREYNQNAKNKRARADRATYRRKTDINFKIRCSLGNSLRSQIVRQNAAKSDHTMALTGCSIEFLKKYIEDQFTKGMTWNNYGRKGWNIDHIKPCAAFDLTKPEEQRACFHYTNLRPLWESDNIKKSSHYNGKFYRIKDLTSSGNNV
jgi:hypothetical protein